MAGRLQGMAFAKHVFGGDPEGKPDYEYIPSAVFSSPPIANVGLSEEEAVEQYKNVDIFTSSYKCAAGHPASICFLAARGRAIAESSQHLTALQENAILSS